MAIEWGHEGAADSGAIRQLSGQDSLFLHVETPAMPMHTVGTVILDPSTASGGHFGYERIVEVMASRLHLMRPFRQRLVEVPFDLGNRLLADDPDFDIENHFHRLGVPAPGTLRELAVVVGDIARGTLERSQPLWDMWVVEGLEFGRIALVARIHHCIMDGASGASQIAHIMDLTPDAPPPELPREAWNPPPLPSPVEALRRSLRVVGPAEIAEQIVKTGRVLARRQAQLELLEEGEEAPLFDGPPVVRFSGAVTQHRSVAYAGADLADIKRIKKAFGVTVNDAVLGVCALAVRRYLECQNDLPELPLHCAVPVSIKSDEEKEELSNKVSAMIVKLPTHLADTEAIIEAVKLETENAKRVFDAPGGEVMQPWAEMVSPLVMNAGIKLYFELVSPTHTPAGTSLAPANLVVSNVRGPSFPLYIGGARVVSIYPMGPVVNGVGLNLTVLSNQDRLDVGIMACRELVPDVWGLAEGFHRAVVELLHAAEEREGGDVGEYSPSPPRRGE